jgi:predicted DNA-binding protein (UPF0251 family)
MSTSMSEVGRKATIEHGVNLVLNEGMSQRKAASLLDIPRKTLQYAIERYSTDPAALKALGEQAATLHLAILAKAGQLVHDGLEAAPYEHQLRAYGIASDKAAAYLGIGRTQDAQGTPEAAAKALALLADALSGRTLEISVRDLAPTPIDVTPTDPDDQDGPR